MNQQLKLANPINHSTSLTFHAAGKFAMSTTFRLAHMYPLFLYLKTNKLHFSYIEQGLIYVNIYIILSKILKDPGHEFHILLFYLKIY